MMQGMCTGWKEQALIPMFPTGKDLVPCIYAYRRSFTGPYLTSEGVLLLEGWLGTPHPLKDLLAASQTISRQFPRPSSTQYAEL